MNNKSYAAEVSLYLGEFYHKFNYDQNKKGIGVEKR